MEVKDFAPLLETGATGTIILLVAWLVRRVFTHTIPRLAEDFKESLKSQQSVFLDQLEKQREDFREALSEQRGDFRESIKNEREDFGRKIDRLSNAVERIVRQSVESPNEASEDD